MKRRVEFKIKILETVSPLFDSDLGKWMREREGQRNEWYR